MLAGKQRSTTRSSTINAVPVYYIIHNAALGAEQKLTTLRALLKRHSWSMAQPCGRSDRAEAASRIEVRPQLVQCRRSKEQCTKRQLCAAQLGIRQ